MILILNGSFGVGKTTVANLIVAKVPGAVIYDPERWGYVLQRLPQWMLRRSEPVRDFQELSLWRDLITGGIRRAHRHARLVVVPMAFSDAGRLRALEDALHRDAEVHTVCLVAPLAVVAERLAQRAARAARPVSAFEHRRSQECVEAHLDPSFGLPVDATRPASSIADEIAGRLSAV